ncbi:hypothetical protein CIHG_00825 [Coccidioides immitis H538.4]|uniref:Uncharacterized protein n=5 Tax=Coccidioides TaxID=5500 RepID=E9CSS7_COCPS|nr:conserved hypothetical protein [Coccidioides posadasii str. Silveira]KMM67466.1 hypothetical protein CPAG_03800 [Coccidioides posadasii RMSCC 3488]KMP03550.1 hypothetical protein CIRG_03242 [Coccidioides immitis RMSCC 2394]KMU73138.1 hypothetical protein CISG_03399 [Coccidioides immitis RMSCC 3703]KMU83043.1 hypothetical protein CIHG_00825 [Coccidioides immitis H538.4]
MAVKPTLLVSWPVRLHLLAALCQITNFFSRVGSSRGLAFGKVARNWGAILLSLSRKLGGGFVLVMLQYRPTGSLRACQQAIRLNDWPYLSVRKSEKSFPSF